MKQKKRRLVPEAGESGASQTAGIEDLMAHPVMTVTRHQTVGHARELMTRHGIHSLPVVTQDAEPEGILTATDFLDTVDEVTLIGNAMTKNVYTIPIHAGLHVAARMMRNHGIHHLVVTDKKRVIGMLSSFDLLRLVEDKRFVVKNQSTPKKRGGGARRKNEIV